MNKAKHYLSLMHVSLTHSDKDEFSKHRKLLDQHLDAAELHRRAADAHHRGDDNSENMTKAAEDLSLKAFKMQ